MMDKILEALVTSSHPLPVKKGIVKKVVDAAENSVDREQCKAMFDLTTRLILIGEDNFQKQVGHQVLDAYARYHRCEFEEFFNKGFILNLLQQGYGSLDKKDIAIIDYIHMGLKLIMSCPSVLEIFGCMHTEILRLVCERPEPLLCARLSELLSDFVHCIPKGKSAVLFCQQLVRTISQFQCSATQEEEIRGFISQVNKVSNLLQSIWKAEPGALLPSLQEVFVIISATDSLFEPSIALASLVQHIPLQMITVLIRSLITDQNVKDASMTCALCRMIDWLSWPLAHHVETWVIALLKGLASVQKFTILIDVTLLKIEQVFHRLWYPIVRPGALTVLSHMLLSFQHSPEAFHLIVPHIIKLVQFLKDEDSPTSKIFLMQLTELVHCMMYQYSGFPDLYEPIIEAIKELPKPSEEKMKMTLNQSAWTSHSNSLASCLSRLSGKSETGKTGLINLGNTCYMNSVIQALFMATDFRRSVLSLNLNGARSLMRKLQLLFAFLAHTQRAAYAPQSFFEESRPPWFTPGSQQDCSEYLRFLLDRLHEEEKTYRILQCNSPQSSNTSTRDCKSLENPEEISPLSEADLPRVEDGKTLIEKMFGGKLQTTICCLNCKSTSQKQEAFTDLSLAFPPCLEDVIEAGLTQSLSSANYESTIPRCCTGNVSDALHSEPPENHSLQVDEIGHGSDMAGEMLQKFPIQSITSIDSCSPPMPSDKLVTVHSNKSIEQNDKTKSVPHLINYFLAPEILNGDNKYYCEKCASLQNAQKIMQVVDEPEYLILTLLRFSYDSKSHIRRKILDDVALPLVLQLPVEKTSLKSPAISQPLLSDSAENLPKKLKSCGSIDSSDSQPVSYLLSSIVVHSGMSSESGHYYCYARNTSSGSVGQLCYKADLAGLPSQGCATDNDEFNTSVIWHDPNCKETSKEWFLFNDSRVTFTSFQSVQNITSKFPKDTAYVLFYKKQGANCGIYPSAVNGLWVNGEPPLQKELMDAITKDNKLYLQEQELNARTRALQASSTTCSFRPRGFDDSDPPGSCGPSGGGGGNGGFNTISRLVF
ncbi:ubiquitin carboxyl-terminal hydrolase 38 [Chiloscyllium plagiosum]|uniref:ubiquitin carboxyl-terminal hydrolase 38 n=1 Tax=Chiloscyllium plagiosum TaxID=36176 RepID=UPI001CB877EF|nr:ubiquitin carboxyl-terminal hydrolase 38 [Chiloscyllium plagiosum]